MAHLVLRVALAAVMAAAPAAAYVLGAAAPPFQARASPAWPVRTISSPTMNLGERFMRLVKSNVNAAINSLEDPEKVLEQAVQDMQRDLVKVRQAYAEVSASTKRMQDQMRLADSEGAKWYQRAQLAIEKGQDDLAREALTRRKQQLEMSASLQEQIEAQQGSITSLYESMKELEAKMAEAKAKKDQIIARARTAKAATKVGRAAWPSPTPAHPPQPPPRPRQSPPAPSAPPSPPAPSQVNDMIAGVGSSSSTAAFDRMSDKVEQLEAEADVAKQLASATSSGAGGSLDDAFKALESGDAVDDELRALKAQQGALPSAVDAELEEMKALLAAEEEEGNKQ